jgi:hypothetical protein
LVTGNLKHYAFLADLPDFPIPVLHQRLSPSSHLNRSHSNQCSPVNISL